MPQLKLKAQYDDKVNLHVYSHSSTRSEMHASSRALIPTRNLSSDLSNTALCKTTCSAYSVLVHLDWAPPAERRDWKAAGAMAKRALGSASR